MLLAMNLKKVLSEYGTILVLLLLGAGFSIVTVEEQWPTDAEAAEFDTGMPNNKLMRSRGR